MPFNNKNKKASFRRSRYNNIHFRLGKSNTCSSKDVKIIRMIVLRDKFRDQSK